MKIHKQTLTSRIDIARRERSFALLIEPHPSFGGE